MYTTILLAGLLTLSPASSVTATKQSTSGYTPRGITTKPKPYRIDSGIPDYTVPKLKSSRLIHDKQNRYRLQDEISCYIVRCTEVNKINKRDRTSPIKSYK
ncbi:MAG: hypothetical protein QNI91_11065 [Arenicellales bacterium]|nr:hypothetical protein [Arenicellales bacterium]